MSSENRNYNSDEELKKSLVYGIRGIIKISELIKKPLKPFLFRIALVLWLLLSVVIFIFSVPSYSMIIEIKNLLIALLPGILGFTIGGYSILIGFTQPELIKKISGPMKNSSFSLYQLASASFACNILIQAMVLVIAYVIHFACWIDTNRKTKFYLPEAFCNAVNNVTLLILLFGFVFSVFIILQLVINVFNFSQLYHYNINMSKKNEN